MGGCLSIVIVTRSSSSGRDDDDSSSTTKVIYMNRCIREYPVPFNVSKVLEADQSSSSSSSSSSSLFICHSNRLYYNNYISALDSKDELEANQIYFVLPRSKLQRYLSATDMAALAVRATLTLQKININVSPSSSSSKKEKGNKGSGRRNYNKARISPVIEMNNDKYANSLAEDDGGDLNMNELTIGGGGSSAYKGQKMMSSSAHGGGSSSVRKLQRCTSRKAKLAARSFRLILLTIHEGSVL